MRHSRFNPIALCTSRLRLSIAVACAVLVLVAGACGSSADPANTEDAQASITVEGGQADTTGAIGSSAPASDDNIGPASVDGEFSIAQLPVAYAPLSSTFTKYVDVWGVSIVATANTDDAKVLHAANVMAQYLDNDADGTVDSPAVLDAMVGNKAILLMASTPDEFENHPNPDAIFDFVGQGGQDLYGSETNPDSGFDASLEEVHHLILNTGWAHVYPDLLAQQAGSSIADAMDIARGGRFETIPASYPDGAWYTYDDETCDYTCMITEYTYWTHTSLLGAQAGRADEIANEWQLETAEKVRATDTAAAQILDDIALGLPTLLPDGTYKG